MFRDEGRKAMRRAGVTIAAALLCAGCAGGPIAIKSAPGARTVQVDGKSIVVSPGPGGTYGATFDDFLANNLYVSNLDQLVRKGQFTRAIELATGCRVVESVMDQGAATFNATVKC